MNFSHCDQTFTAKLPIFIIACDDVHENSKIENYVLKLKYVLKYLEALSIITYKLHIFTMYL